MKIQIINIFLVFSFLLAAQSNALCQDISAILGDDETIEWVLKFEVLDNDSHMPINNARITLREIASRSNIFQIQTDNTGIGVVLIKEVRYMPGTGVLQVIASEYGYWEKEIEQWSFFEKEDSVKLYLLGMKYDWTFSNRPSDQETIAAVKTGNYEVWDSDIIFYGPGIFEFVVHLHKVKKEHEIYYP